MNDLTQQTIETLAETQSNMAQSAALMKQATAEIYRLRAERDELSAAMLNALYAQLQDFRSMSDNTHGDVVAVEKFYAQARAALAKVQS